MVVALMISCSNTNHDAKKLRYKKDIGKSINENLAVNYLDFTNEAIIVCHQIEKGTFKDSDELDKRSKKLSEICVPLIESYRTKGLTQNDIEKITDWHICINALKFYKSYEELIVLHILVEDDKLLLQRNIGAKSEQDIDNQMREIEEKKEEVKGKLESLKSYFE